MHDPPPSAPTALSGPGRQEDGQAVELGGEAPAI